MLLHRRSFVLAYTFLSTGATSFPTVSEKKSWRQEKSVAYSVLGVGSSMYVPTNKVDELVSERCSSNRWEDYSNSPEGTNSCSTAAVVPSSPLGVTTRNIVMERNRRRKFNEKL